MLKYLFLALLLPFSLGTFASQVEDQDFALDLDDDGRVSLPINHKNDNFL